MPKNFLGNILCYTKFRLLDGTGSFIVFPNTVGVEYLYFFFHTILHTDSSSI